MIKDKTIHGFAVSRTGIYSQDARRREGGKQSILSPLIATPVDVAVPPGGVVVPAHDGLVGLQDSLAAGRVHAVCVDRVLYTIHITAPRAQWNDYKEKVYDHLKDTLTITK